MTAREQLYQKLSAEYDAFIAELKGSAPDTILGRAYEKAFKEDIVYSFEQDGAFSDKEIDILLTVEKPLDELYQNWVDTDVSHMDDLSDSISGFAVREIERQSETQSGIISEPKTPERMNNAEPLTPAAQALNGEVNAGDYVIAAPNNDYGHLVGQVIYIDKTGTPEHDTGNPGDDVHVNFHYFNYPPWQRAGFEEHFSELAGGDYHNFDDLPLDDVILAPDMLISLNGISNEKIDKLVSDFDKAEQFCESVMSALPIDREQALLRRLDKNLEEYHNSLMSFGRRDIIEMAGTISAWSEMHSYMSFHAFSDGELDYLMQFQSPLEVVADAWAARHEDMDEKSDFLYDLCDKQGALYDYRLMDVAETPAKAAEPAEKSEPLTPKEQLIEKLRNEYNEFIGELKELPPGKITESSYEKVFKEDLILAVEDGEFSDRQISALLLLDDPLETLYQEWLDTDTSYMDMLHDCVYDASDMLAKKNQQEQTVAEPQAKPKAQAVMRETSLLDEIREAKWEIDAQKALNPAQHAKKHDRGIE